MRSLLSWKPYYSTELEYHHYPTYAVNQSLGAEVGVKHANVHSANDEYLVALK